MTTFVKHPHVSQEVFDKQKSLIVDRLQQAFAGEDITIATTDESVDVHSRNAGKQAGAKVIMDWVKSNSDVSHDNFICFGDSIGDYEMARYFATQDAGTWFVFTGSALSVDEHSSVKVIDTAARYTAGTLEYLNEHSARDYRP